MRSLLKEAVVLVLMLSGWVHARETKSPPPPPQVVQLRVTEKGFEPSPVQVGLGKLVKLVVTRTTDETCATELIIPDANVKVALPLNTPVEVTLTPKKAGQLVYGCAMDMMVSGVLLVQPLN
jgi:plastocyanin domain-containing protein